MDPCIPFQKSEPIWLFVDPCISILKGTINMQGTINMPESQYKRDYQYASPFENSHGQGLSPVSVRAQKYQSGFSVRYGRPVYPDSEFS